MAVMTSVFGLSPFAHQLQPLHHAKTMLLVDDDQTEFLKLRLFFNQRMRADHDVGFTAGDLVD